MARGGVSLEGEGNRSIGGDSTGGNKVTSKSAGEENFEILGEAERFEAKGDGEQVSIRVDQLMDKMSDEVVVPGVKLEKNVDGCKVRIVRVWVAGMNQAPVVRVIRVVKGSGEPLLEELMKRQLEEFRAKMGEKRD